MYQFILFDLDGTITNSEPGILASVRYALGKLGAAEPDYPTLRKFIGPPLRDSFRDYCGLSPERAEEAVRLYREWYAPHGKLDCAVYPGIPKLLRDLHAAGKTVALATSKPEGFARDILEHFGLDRYFTAICGAALDGSRDRKIDVLRYLLGQFPDRKPEETVLIGDTRFDMEGAALAGIDGIGVLYGFGSREELDCARCCWRGESWRSEICPDGASEIALARSEG